MLGNYMKQINCPNEQQIQGQLK